MPKKMKNKNVKSLLWVFFFLFLILGFVRLFILIPTPVSGNSMAPTVLSGDRVLVSTISGIDRFDIVVFQDPNETTVVKRVIGLPGETVHYRNEQLYIDGEPLEESFLNQSEIEEFSGVWTSDYTLPRSEENPEQTMTIPENHYFLMGDNRRFSFDSRFYGSIPEEDIIGEVKLVYYPFDRFQLK